MSSTGAKADCSGRVTHAVWFDRNEYGVKARLDKAARGYASGIVQEHEFSHAGRIINIR
jgi:hypothetical protein